MYFSVFPDFSPCLSHLSLSALSSLILPSHLPVSFLQNFHHRQQLSINIFIQNFPSRLQHKLGIHYHRQGKRSLCDAGSYFLTCNPGETVYYISHFSVISVLLDTVF